MDRERRIVLFESADGEVELPVRLDPEREDVGLSRAQLATLFGRDVKTLGKHVSNALREELAGSENRVVAKFATTARDGKTYQAEHYNLDVIISVGYRVKSARGIEFRRWATDVLRRYIVAGHAENERRLEELGQVIRSMVRIPKQALWGGSEDTLARPQVSWGSEGGCHDEINTSGGGPGGVPRVWAEEALRDTYRRA